MVDGTRTNPAPIQHTSTTQSTSGTSAVTTPATNLPAGVNVTSATTAPISSAQHQHIQGMRNNPTAPPPAFTAAQQQAIANRPEIVAAKGELRALEAAAAQPGADAGALGFQIDIKKIHLIGLTAPHLPASHKTTADALDALNSVETPATQIHPTLHGQDFGHADDANPVDRMIDEMTAQHSLHLEAMGSADPAIQPHLQAAHNLLKCDVAGFKESLQTMVNSHQFLVMQAQQQVKNLDDAEKKVAKAPEGESSGVDFVALKSAARDALTNTQAALAGNLAIVKEFEDKAINPILRDEHIAELHAIHDQPGAHIRAIIGGTLPQMTMSGVMHFGGPKAYVDSVMSEKGLLAKSAAGGAALSTSHIAANTIAKPLLQSAAAKMGGLVQKPVPAAYAYPSPAKVITQNGQVHRLTADEIAAAEVPMKAARKEMTSKQGKGQLGSIVRDAEFYSAFGILGHGWRGAAGNVVEHVAPFMLQDWRAKMVSSTVGGAGAGALQASAQYRQKTSDGIPTHIPMTEEEASFATAWEAAKKGVMDTFDISNPEVRKEHVSRFLASFAGATVSNAVHEKIASIDTSTAKGKAAAAGLTPLESPAILAPFFAAGPTAIGGAKKRVAAGTDPNWARTSDAWKTMTSLGNDPGLPIHSQGGPLKRAENTYQFMRGVMKFPAAITTESLERAVGKPIIEPIAKAVAHPINTAVAAGNMAGRAWENFNPGGLRRRSSTRPEDVEAAHNAAENPEPLGRTTSFERMSQARDPNSFPLPSRQNTGDGTIPTSPLATNNQQTQEEQDAITQAPPRNP